MTRALRIGLGALLVVTLALAAAAVAFLKGIDTDGGFLRPRLEQALSAAFGVPTRIEGPMRLRTGRVATIAADAMVLSDPAGPAGSTLARGIRPSARIDLGALLLQRSVVLEEVTGERLQLALRRQAGGRGNWASLFARSPEAEPRFSFAGIAKLGIGHVEGTYERDGRAAVPFAIVALHAALIGEAPVAARGTFQLAGNDVAFDLRSDSFDALRGERRPIPLQGSLAWRGLQTIVDGQLAADRDQFDAALGGHADDATDVLDALGIATRTPGALDLEAKVFLSGTEARVADLSLQLGRTAVAGSGRLGWTGPAREVALELKGGLVDLTPFIATASMGKAANLPKSLVEALDTLTAGTVADLQLSADAIDGLPVEARGLRAQAQSRHRKTQIQAEADVAGTRIKTQVDYDAERSPHRLDIAIDSRATSTTALPSVLRPAAWRGQAASIGGRLVGEGDDAEAIIASLQGNFEARRVQWSVPRSGEPPLNGHFDVLRLAIQGMRTASVEALGKIDGASCSLKLSGRSLAGSLSGEPWPVTIAGRCPGERLDANGRIAFAGGQTGAELAFELSAERRGPAMRLLNVPAELPRPIAASGSLSVDVDQARARLASLRVGRSDGRSGEIVLPRTGRATPRLRLSLHRLDLNELSVFGEIDKNAPDHPLDRMVLRRGLRLPDLDFAIEADRVDVGEVRLRNVDVKGLMQQNRISSANFRAAWEQLSAVGSFGLDFTGPAPRINVAANAKDADLAGLFKHLDWPHVQLTANRLHFEARAHGERLGELLATARLKAGFEQARFERRSPGDPAGPDRGTVSGTIAASEGQPMRLAARGEVNGLPVDVEASLSGLDAWRDPAAAVPVTLRSTIGDLRLEADGKVLRDGTGSGRLQVSGTRLDRLGHVFDLELPEIAYAASASVSSAPAALDIVELTLRFGDSELGGELKIGRRGAGRIRHAARLRAAALHLENLGTEHWLRPQSDTAATQRLPRIEDIAPAIDEGLARLRLVDLDASIDIDHLYAGGKRLASGRVVAYADGGKLLVQVQDVRAQSAQIDGDITIDAAATPPRYRARADLRDMDYGPLLRALDRNADAEGRLDFVAVLAASGSASQILRHLEGSVDVALYPRGLESRALGLWGTSLIPSILRQIDPNARSAVECGVAGFDIDRGVATSNGFFVDTTRMRISGDIEVDLPTRAVTGRIDARSNEPHLFTLAPTMLVSGTLEAPALTSAPENVVLVPLRFAAPLARFARDWLTRGGRTANSRPGCEEAFRQVREAHLEAAASR